ncbi:MAG: hypothetical protein JSR66_33885 [Proteobacteria bacterium]|nr:hypothetical protein [Pseudomonadota bacterium]
MDIVLRQPLRRARFGCTQVPATRPNVVGVRTDVSPVLVDIVLIAVGRPTGLPRFAIIGRNQAAHSFSFDVGE